MKSFTKVEKQVVTTTIDKPVLVLELTTGEATFLAAIMGNRTTTMNGLQDPVCAEIWIAAKRFCSDNGIDYKDTPLFKREEARVGKMREHRII